MWEMGKIKGVTRRGEGSKHRSNLRDWGIINSKDVWKITRNIFSTWLSMFTPTDLDHLTQVNTMHEKTYSELFVMEAKRFPKHWRLLASFGCFPETEGEF